MSSLYPNSSLRHRVVTVEGGFILESEHRDLHAALQDALTRGVTVRLHFADHAARPGYTLKAQLQLPDTEAIPLPAAEPVAAACQAA